MCQNLILNPHPGKGQGQQCRWNVTHLIQPLLSTAPLLGQHLQGHSHHRIWEAARAGDHFQGLNGQKRLALEPDSTCATAHCSLPAATHPRECGVLEFPSLCEFYMLQINLGKSTLHFAKHAPGNPAGSWQFHFIATRDKSFSATLLTWLSHLTWRQNCEKEAHSQL